MTRHQIRHFWGFIAAATGAGLALASGSCALELGNCIIPWPKLAIAAATNGGIWWILRKANQLDPPEETP